MRVTASIIAATFCIAVFVACRSASSEVADANRRYEKAAYDRALASYQHALSRVRPTSLNAVRLRYNIGTTYYQLNQTGTATAELLQTAERAPLLRGKQHDPFRVRVYYNLGNSFFREGDFGRAVDAYIEALKLDASDQSAKHNLELALDRLRQQTSSGGPPQPDTPNPTPEPGEGDPQPLPQRPAGISPDEARRLLDMLGNDDAQRQQQRLRHLVPPHYEVEKDW
jgi:tetratricopeptide (TPR) repeat protein